MPKPFNFDIRDKTRAKSIRERKFDEMVADKDIKEKKLIKHRFKAKNPPPEVLVPRYNQILERKEQRRAMVKANSIAITKQNEKPFSFYLRD